MPKTEQDNGFTAIDPLRLDEEWQGQARRYKHYSDRLAEARLEADRAKSALEVVKAETELDIRSNPEKFGLPKSTEATVAAAVVTHNDVRNAVENLHRLNYNVHILEGARTALDHRKKALENLVSLHLAGYYAEPRARGDGDREEVEEMNKQAARRKARRRPVEDDDQDGEE